MTRRRRMLRAVEPIGLLFTLCILSMGVIKVVEVGVPTRADAEFERRREVQRSNMRQEVRDLAETFEVGWVPSLHEDADIFAADFEGLDVAADPLKELTETSVDDPALIRGATTPGLDMGPGAR